MIDSSLLHLISIPIYLAILLVGRKKKFSLQKHIIVFLFFIYTVGVFSVTLFPLPIQKELIDYYKKSNYIKNELIPFKSIFEITGNGYKILILNIALFIPLGSFLPLLFKKVSNLGKTIFCGLICSIGIESLQFFISLILGFNYRVTSIDDVILNTTGAAIGFMLLKLVLPILKNYFDLSYLQQNKSA